MPTPITWRNVAINSGAGSAALGAAASRFGRNATEGLGLFSEQMQDRVTQEDERLTNEAISAALSGGPSVSPNRRVDANVLQQAVERNRLGRRQAASHVQALETGRLANIGQGFQNEQDEFTVANQEETLRLEQELKQAQINNQAQQTATSARQEQVALQAFNDNIQARRVDAAVQQEIFTDRPARIRDELLASPEIQARIQDGSLTGDALEQVLAIEGEERIRKLESDPDYLPSLYARAGGTDANFRASTLGAEWLQQRQLVFQAEIERGEARLETQAKNLEAAQSFIRDGDTSNVIYDPNAPGGFAFREGKTISANDAKTYADNAGLDTSGDDEEVTRAIGQVRTHFADASTFRKVMGDMITKDGELDPEWEKTLVRARGDAEAAAGLVLNDSGRVNPNLTFQQRVDAAAGIGTTGTTAAGTTPEEPRLPAKEQKAAEGLAELNLDLDIHPERTGAGRRAAVDAVQTLMDEITTKRRNGGRLPLSDKELANKRRDLANLLRKLKEEPLGPIPAGINIGIQPK
jgi:hypothetical protein